MKQKSSPLYGVGILSVFTVLVVLLYLLMGILSLSSAQADARLTAQTADYVTSVYAAESRCAELMASCAKLTSPEGLIALVKEGETVTFDGDRVTLTVPVTERQAYELVFTVNETLTPVSSRVLGAESSGELPGLSLWLGDE